MRNSERVVQLLQWPILVMALLVVPVLVLEDRATDPQIRAFAHVANWVIWLTFTADFLIRWLARGTSRHFREAWFDLVLILVSPPFLAPDYLQSARGLRAVRALRMLRLLRAGAVAGIALRVSKRLFGRRKFHYTALLAVAVVLLGALGVLLAESGRNRSITSFGDALWWAIVTATTVGYGDVSPITTEGRLIAVFLMLTGIGVIGVFTATVANYFFESDTGEAAALAARLTAIEEKLDRLLVERLARDAEPR
jgi:voltage-gated potassium channel